MQEIIDYALNTTKPTVEQKEITIEVIILITSPRLLQTKKKAWVITNLLSNAIRYADENSTIKIKGTRSG